MLDKYLKQDYKTNAHYTGKNEKFLLTKKELSEDDYLKFSKDAENNMDPNNENFNEHNYIMKDEDNEIKGKLSQQSLDALKANEIEELNDPTLESEENLMKNYLNMENLYLNEGKAPEKIRSLSIEKEENHPKSIENIIPEHNSMYSLVSDKYLDKNEFKLKRLQEKIEEKLKKEYDEKIRIKEKEIKQKTRNEFEEAITSYKNQFQVTLEEDKKKLEDEIKQKWEEKYDELLIQCKSKLREDKEQKLAQKMYQKLKPGIEQEIYKNEYGNIVEKIKIEIEDKLSKDIQEKKIEEIAKVKKKMEYYTKVKLEEMEKSIKDKCKEEMEMEIKKEIERKEKEFRTNYMKKFEVFKINLEKQLKEDYDAKKSELAKEISEMKSKVYRQKIAENIKINKLNNIKKNLIEKEKSHLGKAEKLEKVLNSLSKTGMSSKSFLSGKNENASYVKANSLLNNECQLEDVVSLIEMNNSNSNAGNSGLILQQQPPSTSQAIMNQNLTKITEEEDHQASSSIKDRKSKALLNSPTLQNNSVNLQELNKKFKSLSPMNTIEKANGNLKTIPEKEIEVNVNPLLFSRDQEKKECPQFLNSPISHDAYMLDSPTRFKDEYYTKDKEILNANNANQKFQPRIHTEMSNASIQCYSLQLDDNIPTSLVEFGKYLVNHIEKEENFRILFEKEKKKLKLQLKKVFDSDNSTDHCLTDYLLELWEKIDISYSNRYRILNKLVKSKSTECYSFLDRETEYLTDYFQKSQEIFQLIQTRERLKMKLQQKANKNELKQEDKQKFTFLTKEVEKKVKSFTEKCGINIIWKGIKYDWLMNYETWFYENNK